MRLESLEILNFCQFRELAAQFGDGLIGVVGANGSGKSNFLGSIRFALTGENPTVGKLADNVCQLAPITERSQVRLAFSHAGVRAVVTRVLRPAGTKATLEILTAPGEILRGDANVNLRIAQILGIEFDVLNELVLVAQDDIFGFLDQIPSKRAASFQRLFRTEAATTLHATIGTYLASVQPAPVSLTSAECLAKMEAAIDSRESWQLYAAALRDAAAVQSLRDAAVKVVGNYEAYRGVRAAVAADESRLAAVEGQRVPVLEAVSYHANRVAGLTAAKEAQRGLVGLARHSLVDLAEARRVAEIRQRITEGRRRHLEEQAALSPPMKPVAYADSDSRNAAYADAYALLQSCRAKYQGDTDGSGLRDAIAGREARRRQLTAPARPGNYKGHPWRYDDVQSAKAANEKLQAFVSAFEHDEVVCPTCGTPTSALASQLEAARAELPKLQLAVTAACDSRDASDSYDRSRTMYEQECVSLDREIAASAALLQIVLDEFPVARRALEVAVANKTVSENYDSGLRDYNERVASLKSCLYSWDAQEAALPAVVAPDVDEAGLLEIVKADEGYAAEIEHQNELLNAQRNGLARIDGEISQLQATLAQRRNSLAAVVDVSEAEVATAREARDALDGELSQIRTTQETLRQARQSLDYWQAQFTQAQAQESQAAGARAVAAHMTALRDLFHHTALPRFVTHRNLQRLQTTINDGLELFQTDYRVEPTDGWSFRAFFTDGRVQAAERLSWGQKVILALIFRLATNIRYTNNIGFLGLDEPTAYLDEHHIRGFEPVLAQLRAFASSRGLQCMIITHERSLAPLFDTVVQL